MSEHELTQLELLAEIDTLVEDLRAWAESAPGWEPARTAQALIRRLLERVEGIRIKLDAPLVVATLGGTGTGKSALLNALLGQEVLPTGLIRPTTCRPTLLCRPDISPEMLGILPSSVEVFHRELPVLADLVLIDCPDPDTSESPEEAASNLARLRQILPYCDVILITGTQQKYRSGRVAEELARAATGARLIFVQTHADQDKDIRDDWQKVLQPEYAVSRIFLIDSLQALDDVRSGRTHQPEIQELLDLLTRRLSGSAASRIRRANLLDLTAEALHRCGEKIRERMGSVKAFQGALYDRREKFLRELFSHLAKELQSNQRYWENRLLSEVLARWGSSPWSWVLRIYQSLGMVVVGLFGRRLPVPAPWLVWGAVGGWQWWRRRQTHRSVEQRLQALRSVGWDPSQVRQAGVELQGYAFQAGLDPELGRLENLLEDAQKSVEQWMTDLTAQWEENLRGQADRHSRWPVRLFYDCLFLTPIVLILYRLAKNYFWDSWLDPTPDSSLYGMDFYLGSVFWLFVWAVLLIWVFLYRLRRGFSRQMLVWIGQRKGQSAFDGLFSQWEEVCQKIERFSEDLKRLQDRVERMRRNLAGPEDRLSRRRA